MSFKEKKFVKKKEFLKEDKCIKKKGIHQGEEVHQEEGVLLGGEVHQEEGAPQGEEVYQEEGVWRGQEVLHEEEKKLDNGRVSQLFQVCTDQRNSNTIQNTQERPGVTSKNVSAFTALCLRF
jgi:hypothetical protein